jgi:hypothetical protein
MHGGNSRHLDDAVKVLGAEECGEKVKEEENKEV